MPQVFRAPEFQLVVRWIERQQHDAHARAVAEYTSHVERLTMQQRSYEQEQHERAMRMERST